jgi:hypothetical protein
MKSGANGLSSSPSSGKRGLACLAARSGASLRTGNRSHRTTKTIPVSRARGYHKSLHLASVSPFRRLYPAGGVEPFPVLLAPHARRLSRTPPTPRAPTARQLEFGRNAENGNTFQQCVQRRPFGAANHRRTQQNAPTSPDPRSIIACECHFAKTCGGSRSRCASGGSPPPVFPWVDAQPRLLSWGRGATVTDSAAELLRACPEPSGVVLFSREEPEERVKQASGSCVRPRWKGRCRRQGLAPHRPTRRTGVVRLSAQLRSLNNDLRVRRSQAPRGSSVCTSPRSLNGRQASVSPPPGRSHTQW